MRDSVAESEGENLPLGVWLRTGRRVMEPAGKRVGHKREQNVGVLALEVGPGAGGLTV